jgi:RNA polymerase sigma-54 factor
MAAALELRQGQGLVMTQQLRQSIHMLQLSTPDLNELIDVEIEKNPLLAREEEITHDSPETLSDAVDGLDLDEGVIWGMDSGRYDHIRDGAHAQNYDIHALSEEMEQRLSVKKTLHDALLEQIDMQEMTVPSRAIMNYMVDMVDAAGYLPEDSEQRAALVGIDAAHYGRAVAMLQACEPTGVGARNLRECLALQLEERGQLSDAMRTVLAKLDWIMEGKHKQLCRECRLSTDQLSEIMQQIKACNPKPASGYDVTMPQTLIPEVLVRRKGEGEWVVELNHEVLPKLLIDRDYVVRLKRGVRDKNDSKAINDHLANAAWLTKALHQRSMTLMKVAVEIVRLQQDFFDYGIHYLKPMTLKDIAAKAECHESTVSRITTQKFLSCGRGMFELKYFFTSTLNNANGGSAYSSRSVMQLIRTMIEAEVANAILSDDDIAETLKKQGIDVARRTVVKYRQQMEIPSSVQRRRNKKIAF